MHTGFIQTTGEWPFAVHFFTEAQLDHFANYCKTTSYSYLHIDATGSVIRKISDQKDVYFYSMVFKSGEDPSNTLPLSGALLGEHTSAFITSYFNCVRSRLEQRCTKARPSFVVIDFSPAILNSTLSSFNVETVKTNLRRCFNTMNFAYDSSQLRNMTFVRLCCSHVLKAFSRSLYKIEPTKNIRQQIMTLFAVLLNCYNPDGAFDLFHEIMNIYADPYNEQSPRKLLSLLSNSYDNEQFVEQYLDVDENNEDEPHFLDEINITTDAIIHQSPFTVKACDRMPILKEVVRKEMLKTKPTNPLFSTKIAQLFYKWFAYVPLWSGLMVEFIDR